VCIRARDRGKGREGEFSRPEESNHIRDMGLK